MRRSIGRAAQATWGRTWEGPEPDSERLGAMSTITAEGTTPSPAVELPSKRITPGQLERLAARVTSTAGNDPMEIEQPFTGKPLGTVPKCGPDDVRAAIERARAVHEQWAQTSFA